MANAVEQRIRDLQEVSIAIDSWDDVFSDFDPRPLEERTLSEDFVNELQKRHYEQPSGALLVKIWAPPRLRDAATEALVCRRLQECFALRAERMRTAIRRERRRGAVFFVCGFLCLAAMAFTTLFVTLPQAWRALLEITLMPLGWFGMWEGVGKMVDLDREAVQQRTLYRHLAEATFQICYLDG